MFLSVSSVSADGPVVNSFTVNQTSVNNSYSASFVWQMASTTGGSITFSCPAGVSVTDSNGTSITCGTPQNFSDNSGSLGYFFYNVAGSTKTVTVRLLPKDLNGTSVDSIAVSVSLSVNAATRTVTDFSISSSTVDSLAPVTLTWTSVYVKGVNLFFDCMSGLQYFQQGNTAPLPCGGPALTSDLAASGSTIISVSNPSQSPNSVRIQVVPAIGDGTYDGSHALSATVSVAGTPLYVPPSASTFSASKQTVNSKESFSVSWTSSDSYGANIQMTCAEGLFLYAEANSTSTPAQCGVPAFSSDLPATGTASLSVSNNYSGVSKSALLVLLLKQKDGSYTTMGSKSVYVTILQPSAASTTVSSSTPQVSAAQPSFINPFPDSIAQTSVAVQAPVAVSASNSQGPKITLALVRGSRGAQVSSLQRFLAKDRRIYPEGLVTGFLGSATEAAVKRFQVRYKLASPGVPGYGLVGPKTRAKMNSLVTP